MVSVANGTGRDEARSRYFRGVNVLIAHEGVVEVLESGRAERGVKGEEHDWVRLLSPERPHPFYLVENSGLVVVFAQKGLGG